MNIFTKREIEIIKLIVNGKSKKQIADCLHLSVHTIKATVERIFQKTNVHSKVALVLYLFKNHSLQDFEWVFFLMAYLVSLWKNVFVIKDEKERKFFEAKHVGTFIASEARPHQIEKTLD